MLRIPWDVIEEMVRHGRQAYPAECCGLLVGTNGRERRVAHAYRARNLQGKETPDRYEVDPLDFWKVDQELTQHGSAGLEVIGFYHSHPNHAPSPSPLDQELAWPGYIYVIFSVAPESAGPLKAWTMEEGATAFGEEPVFLQP